MHVNVGLFLYIIRKKGGKMKICKEIGAIYEILFVPLHPQINKIDCRINKTGEQFYYE